MLPRKKSGAGKWIVFITIVLLIAGAIILFYSRRDSKAYESVKAEISDITTYRSFSGNIEAKHRQTIISEKVMQVSEIYVKEGDAVKNGDVLAKTTSGDRLTADIDGEVASIGVDQNAVVMSGAKLMEIVDYSNLEVKVRVDEYDIGSLKKGKAATVKIGALNKEIKGKISDVSSEGVVTNGVTYFTSTIDLNKDPALKVGMSAEVKLIDNTAKGVVTIPMSVVQFDDNNTPYVLKDSEKGRPVRTNIVTGINNGTVVEVKKGITDGETVLYMNPANNTGMRFGGRKAADGNAGGGSDND
ncbi:MAG TPA: HlyD family efflux transporter periplasmic adaptor subunit [Ruminiclostridium sp.]|nr:HlyD family efflux transporter periplasmic adaptor subunit [Ruminiclostridium sp.]